MHASDPVSRYFSHNLFLLSPRGWGDGSRRMLRPGGNGHEVFQARVLTAGSGGQEEDLSRQVFNMFFVSFCEGRTDGGISATAPHQNIVFPDESAYACTHTGEKHAVCVVEECAKVIRSSHPRLISGAKLRCGYCGLKFFRHFFKNFFSAINDTCQGIVKLSNCQTHFFRCHLYSKISHPCIFILT